MKLVATVDNALVNVEGSIDVEIDSNDCEGTVKGVKEAVEHALEEKYKESEINYYEYEIENLEDLITSIKYEEFLDKTTAY